MRKWLLLPLRDLEGIRTRHDAVEYWINHSEERDAVTQQIKSIGDLERLISKISLGKVNPREMVQLARSLQALVPVHATLDQCSQQHLHNLYQVASMH